MSEIRTFFQLEQPEGCDESLGRTDADTNSNPRSWFIYRGCVISVVMDSSPKRFILLNDKLVEKMVREILNSQI